MRSTKKIFLLILPLVFFACNSDQHKKDELKPGAYYSIMNDAHSYAVAKIIALDEKGVHIRLYANTFPQRPDSSILPKLTLDGPHAMKHMPILRAAFLRLLPSYIAKAPVTQDELEGYNEWKKRGGGYLE